MEVVNVINHKTGAKAKLHTCLFCDYSTIRKYDLAKHERRIHTGLRPFSCSICEKTFVDASGRKRHEDSMHNDVRPFACKHCDKRFKRKQHLDEHERMHLGIKPFSCKVCNKSFSVKSSLLLHELNHKKKDLLMQTELDIKEELIEDPEYFDDFHELESDQIDVNYVEVKNDFSESKDDVKQDLENSLHQDFNPDIKIEVLDEESKLEKNDVSTSKETKQNKRKPEKSSSKKKLLKYVEDSLEKLNDTKSVSSVETTESLRDNIESAVLKMRDDIVMLRKIWKQKQMEERKKAAEAKSIWEGKKEL
eukprot:TRINITY_DN5585_c0_g1_i3.p1 TRINITY_DN5585_c0_g1~~TRINITY_DN5585_c0_g1_i3.p1  ORF type:complete len:306 (-),score=42.27 TRINITY_DN5585_c0_g1_i3:263-1180(-)